MAIGQQQAAGLIGAIQAAGQSGAYPFWFPPKARGLAIDYFAYGTDFVPLGAGATVANPINITNDSAFCILSAVMVETDISNLVFLPQRPLLASLQDSGSGRNFSSTPVHADNWFGTAEEPKYWDIPKILSPNTTFTVQLQNLDPANARNCRVTFHGFKIFGFVP